MRRRLRAHARPRRRGESRPPVDLYNYAHLPSLFKPQRRILAADMPSAEARLQTAMAIGKLTDAGYVFIGMDHFAKPDDELAIAQREKRLHRNFQGYSTHADCDMMSPRHLVDQQGRRQLLPERQDARRIL